jgi:hypothetical protein
MRLSSRHSNNTSMSDLPPEIQQHLPDGRIPVLTFLTIALPEVITTNRIMQSNKYVSSLPPNSKDIDEMLRLAIPPPDIVYALQHLIGKPEQSVASIICPHVAAASRKRYPLIVVLGWVRLLELHGIQSKWKDAVDTLQRRIGQEPGSVLVREALQALSYLPWSGYVEGLESKVETHNLSAFFTTEWLSDNHEELMLELLKIDLRNAGQHDILVEHTAFMLLLAAAHADRQNYASDRHYAWLRMRGEDLATGRKSSLATIVNQNGNHWVGTAIDFKTGCTFYGDSIGNPISTNLQEVIVWWIGYHTGSSFSHHNLPISHQLDTHSCGILIWDSLRCFLLKTKPRLMDANRVDDSRLEIFLRLVGPYRDNQVDPITHLKFSTHHAFVGNQPSNG